MRCLNCDVELEVRSGEYVLRDGSKSSSYTMPHEPEQCIANLRAQRHRYSGGPEHRVPVYVADEVGNVQKGVLDPELYRTGSALEVVTDGI